MTSTDTGAATLPAIDRGPGSAIRLRASRATVALLRELLAEAEVDPDLLARLIESDPAVTVHVLQKANANAATGEELDTVSHALEVLDRWTVAAVTEGRGRTGAALGALLGYLADDPALIARHGFEPKAAYDAHDAYVQGATTAMTTRSVLAEQGARAPGETLATGVAQVPQQRSHVSRGDRDVRPPVGAGASPSEEHR